MNIVTLNDQRITNKKVPAICVEIDRNNKKYSSNPADGQNVSTVLPLASTLATCRNDYPLGCTILECRLDPFNRPMAQILQVPAPDSDVNNRKMGLYVEAKQTPCGPYSRVTSCPIEDTCCEQFKDNVQLLRTYALESGNISNNDESIVSKIVYGPILEKNEICNRRERCLETTDIEVECVPTIEEKEECYSTGVRQKQEQILENIVKPEEYVYRFTSNCEDNCTEAVDKLLSQFCERRNGLDPTTISQSTLCPTTVDRAIKKPNRICLVKCCKPIEKSLLDKSKEFCSKPEKEYKRDIKISSKSVESLECPILKKCTKDAFSLSTLEDSLEVYKDYISTDRLEKYRACRSKRNGLQDECILPVPRALLERRQQEQCNNELEKNVDQAISIKRKTSQTSQLDYTICT